MIPDDGKSRIIIYVSVLLTTVCGTLIAQKYFSPRPIPAPRPKVVAPASDAPITLAPASSTQPIERHNNPQGFATRDITAAGVWQEGPKLDSFVAATLIALASNQSGRKFLSDMIEKSDDSTFQVYFPRENAEIVTKDQIDKLKLANREPWASVVEAAFVRHFDVDGMKRQIDVTGQPAIVLALNALSDSGNQVVNPSKESPASLDKLFRELISQQAPIVVSLKNPAEVETPLLEHPIALAVVGYDGSHKVVTLQGAYADKMRASAQGLRQTGPATYLVPIKVLPIYVRFIAFNQAPY